MAKQKLSKEEKKLRHNARVARCRFLKNLFIWILGVLFIPTVIVVSTMVIPLKFFTGSDGKIVSQEFSDQSLFKVITTVSKDPSAYGIKDFPVIVDEVDDLLGNVAGNLITVDRDKLLEVKFGSEMGEQIGKCFEITATLKNFGGAEVLGGLGTLNVFTDWENAEKTVLTVRTESNKSENWTKLYYYSLGENKYARAFDDNGNAVSDVTDSTELYYPALEDILITDMFDILGDTLDRVKVKSLLQSIGAYNEKFIKILGENTTVKGLASFDFDAVKLKEVVDIEDSGDNHKFWAILKQAAGVIEDRDITIGDLSDGFEINDVLLSEVIKNDPLDSNNQRLWEIINSAVTPEDAEIGITLNDLNYHFSVNNVNFDSVIPSSVANSSKVLKALYGKDYTIGQIGDKINELQITDIFDVICFTQNAAEAVDTSAKYTKADNAYTLSDSGTYYISKNAEIWLFILYSTEEASVSTATATKGAMTKYTAKNIKFSEFDSNVGDMADTLINSTVKQLIEAGILTENTSGKYSNIYDKTLQEVFDLAATI